MNMNVPMQPAPTAYKLIQAESAGQFEQQVNAALQDGWTFHGPTIQCDSLYTQPMVKLEMRPIKMPKVDGSILPVEAIIRQQ
jgi:hypothetical protein